jgi:putative PEP-CTERM system histidine kinase
VDLSNITLAAWSFGSAGVAYTALSWHLLRVGYLRAHEKAASRFMLAAVGCTALWGWFGVANEFADTVTFIRLAALTSLVGYACWFAFLLRLLRTPSGELAAAAPRWLAAVVAAVLLANLAVWALVALKVGGLDDQARVLQLGLLVLPVVGLVLTEQLVRNMPAEVLWNAKPLCLGLAGIFLFDLYRYSYAVLFGGWDGDATSIHGAFLALMALFFWQSSLRRADWIQQLRLSQRAAFHSATLLLSGLFLLFISGVGYYVRLFGGEWGRALQLGLVFVALVLLSALAMSGSMRAKLRVLLGKHFFRYRYDYREEWLRFTQTLSAQSSPQMMGQQVVRGLADMLESPAGSLWTKVPNQPAYRQTALWNMPACAELEQESSPMCRFMVRTGWVINLEEYRSVPGRYPGLSLPPWLQQITRAWLVVPLCVADQTIGFVVLASARTPLDVNWEVNDLLKTAGRQAASFLAQMQATEALLEVRKFDAFNRMSAFVVHDLKNIVTQLSLMMKNAKRLHADPEFQQDMLMTVENALDRMRQMMLQLREGARPPGSTFGVDLGPLARRVQADVRSRGRQLEVHTGARLLARGHEERLERVIGHVVHNALDATESQGRVWLKIEKVGGQACVEVGDTGHGMSQEFIRDRLFKPFQTTKQTGMGIGAYESYQYVQELGGSIDVRSEPGEGTVVSLRLPLFETTSESDLQELKAQ